MISQVRLQRSIQCIKSCCYWNPYKNKYLIKPQFSVLVNKRNVYTPWKDECNIWSFRSRKLNIYWNKKQVLHAFQLIYLEHLEIFAITFAWQALEEIEENVPACRTVETDPECRLWWWHEMPQNSWISHRIFSSVLLHFLMGEKNMYLFGFHEEDSAERIPYNPILHYPYSSWIKKTMAKTTE